MEDWGSETRVYQKRRVRRGNEQNEVVMSFDMLLISRPSIISIICNNNAISQGIQRRRFIEESCQFRPWLPGESGVP